MKKEVFESDFGVSYTKAVLDNGLSVYVMEKPGYNSSYAVFGTRFGSVDISFETGGERVDLPAGIAHYLEHKLFESEDGDAFTKYAKTGASANAYTSFDRTCYLFSCSSKFKENFDILLDLVGTPYFTPETVQKEQGIIGQEIRMYDDSPEWRSLFSMLEEMYHAHPVREDIAGTVESIAKIDYKMLYKCYETFYNPSNMFICVCGNVNADEIIKTAQNKIGFGKPCDFKMIEEDEPQTVKSNYTEAKLPVMIPSFCFGFKQKITEPFVKLKNQVCMSLLLELLAGDCSPLFEKLTKAGLISDEFDSEYFTGRNYAAVIFEGESENPEKVAEEIKREIARLKTEGIDKKLFSAVKCKLYGDLIRRFDSVSGTVSGFVEAAMFNYDLFDEIKLLKTATAGDIYKMLDVFCEENSVLSVIKPTEE